MDKTKLKDTMGRPLTQGLFIDFNYDDKYAVYTLEDEDKEYKGVVYPSLKKLYLECEDPTEYQFSKKHLLGWRHWQRLKENKALRKHFDEWREELEVALVCEAVMTIRDNSPANFQAAKWLADRGWDKKGAGRPSKADAEREKRISSKVDEQLNADIVRMSDWQ